MRPLFQYVAKSIAIFSLLLLSSCSGSGERTENTDPTGLVTFYILDASVQAACGDIKVTVDGIEIGTVTYAPNYVLQCGKFQIPGQITYRTSISDDHTWSAVSAGTQGCYWNIPPLTVEPLTVPTTACLSIKLYL